MSKKLSSEVADRLLAVLSAALRKKTTIKEASRLLGYGSPKQLYNRLLGHTPFPFDEILRLVDQLELDLASLLSQAGLLQPPLWAIADLLRYYCRRIDLEDSALNRFMKTPPESPLASPNEVNRKNIPTRFVDLEGLRLVNPGRATPQIRAWLEASYLAASVEPNASNLVSYCSALDLTATDIAGRGHHVDGALLLAHALELCPPEDLFFGYLVEHSAATFKRLGEPRIGAFLAKIAIAEADLKGATELVARSYATLASIYTLLAGEAELLRAEHAFLRICEIAPQSRYAVTAGINCAYAFVQQDRAKQALDLLDKLAPGLVQDSVKLGFHTFWIRGKAYAALQQSSQAADQFEAALAFHTGRQDPANLLLILHDWRCAQGGPTKRWGRSLESVAPHLNRIRGRLASAITAQVLGAMLSQNTPDSEVETLVTRLRDLERDQP